VAARLERDTNGLLRRYFPKRTGFSVIAEAVLD